MLKQKILYIPEGLSNCTVDQYVEMDETSQTYGSAIYTYELSVEFGLKLSNATAQIYPYMNWGGGPN